MKTSTLLLSALASTALAAPGYALAQAAAAPDSSTTVSEIVVTAQRREESIQKVPIAVTAVSAATLENANLTSTRDLQNIVPGLVMTFQVSTSTPYIRGVGAEQGGIASEPNVSTYVDGIYIGPSMGNIFDFNNIERLEVERGPQGTLFGRNATGGLIQVITKTPTQERVLDVAGSYGSYNTVTGNVYLAGGLSDMVAADVAVTYANRMKGYGHNVHTGAEINYGSRGAIRTKFVITPTAALKITLAADYGSTNDDYGLNKNVFPGAVGFGGTLPQPDPQNVNQDGARNARLTQAGASAKIAYAFDSGFEVSSITALRRYTQNEDYDSDFSPLKLAQATFRDTEQTFQQELLLQKSTERLNFTTGVFYYRDVALNNLGLSSNIVPTLNNLLHSVQTTKSYAIFAQGTYEIFADTHLTLGARYTYDTQSLKGVQTTTAADPRGAGVILSNGDHTPRYSDHKPTWRIAVDHQFTPDIMGYVSYSRGFKLGGLNTNSFTQKAIFPEVLDDVEGGLKSRLLEGRLQVNIGAFNYDYKNIQLQTPVAGSTVTLNAAGAHLYGAEFEVNAVPAVSVGHLNLRAALSLEHAIYTDFKNLPKYLAKPATCLPTPMETGLAVGGNIICTVDGTGSKVIHTPSWTLGVGADYSVPAGSGTLGFHIDDYHTAGFNWSPDGRLKQPAYDLLNGKIDFKFGETHQYVLEVYGKNLLDADYFGWALESTTGFGDVPGQPRTFGVGFKYHL